MSKSPADAKDTSHLLGRWRLVLGRSADVHGVTLGDDAELARIESLLGFLFDESGESGHARKGSREGGKGGSQLTVPEWVDSVAQETGHEGIVYRLLRRLGPFSRGYVETAMEERPGYVNGDLYISLLHKVIPIFAEQGDGIGREVPGVPLGDGQVEGLLRLTGWMNLPACAHWLLHQPPKVPATR